MTSNTKRSTIAALLVAIILVAAACTATPPASPTAPASTPTPGAQPTPGGQPTPGDPATPEPQPTPTDAVIQTPVPGNDGYTSDGKKLIRWFVGLGTGERPNHIEVEQAVVDEYNANNPDVFLSLEIYRNAVAYDTLATQIATGNAPDIIGPIGIRALQAFGDQLLDISPYIGDVDLSEIPQGLIDAYNVDGKQIGLPMAVYPSFFYVNKALFDEAGLNYPPQTVGEKYVWPDGRESDWNWETVREVGMLLTVDAQGNDATSPDFDAENIVQYGLDSQWTENDIRAWGTVFGGSGSIVAEDGTSAQFPENWATGLEYFYNGIWSDHFIPNKAAVDAMAGGNSFQSGQVAMDVVHMWYTCCVYPAEGTPPVEDWDIAVLPVSPQGTITSKLHADTIGILASTRWPAEAFHALSYLSSDPRLTTIYGAMPPRPSQQAAFFASLDERFAPLEINWDVATQMLEYPDVPSHEAFMPNFQRADAANKALGSKLWTTPGLDLSAEFAALVAELNGIFAEAP
jgi:multiple sugar transport system substrate-binding protein